MVTKLDRLARSVGGVHETAEELAAAEVRLNIGGAVHDPTDAVCRLLFDALVMVTEFEFDLIRARTREAMAVARSKGWLQGKFPKLSPKPEADLVGEHTVGELAELFTIGRSRVYRALERAEPMRLTKVPSAP